MKINLNYTYIDGREYIFNSVALYSFCNVHIPCTTFPLKPLNYEIFVTLQVFNWFDLKYSVALCLLKYERERTLTHILSSSGHFSVSLFYAFVLSLNKQQ